MNLGACLPGSVVGGNTTETEKRVAKQVMKKLGKNSTADVIVLKRLC